VEERRVGEQGKVLVCTGGVGAAGEELLLGRGLATAGKALISGAGPAAEEPTGEWRRGRSSKGGCC
jgi:hypothetical protein